MCTIRHKVKSQKNSNPRPRDFKALKNSVDIRNSYENHISKTMHQNVIDKDSPLDSLNNLQRVLSNAVDACVPPLKPTPFRKREVSVATRQLVEERRKNFHKHTPDAQKAAARAISNSSRNDYRAYIDGILDDMASAEAVGNTREVNRLVKTLGGKTNQPSPMPSKDLNGDPIVSAEQLLSDWNTFLCTKFASAEIDHTSQMEATVAQEDHLTDA